jgi:hypothetical protein
VSHYTTHPAPVDPWQPDAGELAIGCPNHDAGRNCLCDGSGLISLRCDGCDRPAETITPAGAYCAACWTAEERSAAAQDRAVRCAALALDAALDAGDPVRVAAARRALRAVLRGAA